MTAPTKLEEELPISALDASREIIRLAWREMNAIRASHGAPDGVSDEYWSNLVDALRRLIGDDALPWPTKAAKVLYDLAHASTCRETDRAIAAETELASLRTRLKAAEALAEARREALEPFGRDAGNWADDVPDNYQPRCTEPGKNTAYFGSETAFTVGDLRHARTLTKEPNNVG